MGLFSGIASFCTKAIDTVKSFFKPSPEILPFPKFPSPINIEHSPSTTTYDPDRVKAAQLDKERAQIENERVELMKQAQLDIIEAQKQSRIAQEQAKAEGFVRIAEAVTAMQEKLNELAARRLAIIERGTLQAVREAEEFYAELMRTIQQDNDRYTAEKLPRLLEILGRYEEGSSLHTLYMKKIDEDITLQAQHTARQLESAVKRQERMIDEIMTAKGEINDQTGKITAGILEALREKIGSIDAPNLPGMKEIPALTA